MIVFITVIEIAGIVPVFAGPVLVLYQEMCDSVSSKRKGNQTLTIYIIIYHSYYFIIPYRFLYRLVDFRMPPVPREGSTSTTIFHYSNKLFHADFHMHLYIIRTEGADYMDLR